MKHLPIKLSNNRLETLLLDPSKGYGAGLIEEPWCVERTALAYIQAASKSDEATLSTGVAMWHRHSLGMNLHIARTQLEDQDLFRKGITGTGRGSTKRNL